ncbi:MAG: M14 family metallopeptidase [Spirochaetaceae bacterium]
MGHKSFYPAPAALVVVASVLLTATAHMSFAQSGSGEHSAAGDSAEVIGRSVEGRPITVERVGSGSVDVLIVGGIHGGYEANSIVLARRFLEYYSEHPQELPEEVTLHVIDNMNPDGLHRVTGDTPIEEFDFRSTDTAPGRFNARQVDLNRNWDGDWQPTSYWGNREVDAGSAPFSEPETRAVRDYVERIDPAVSVFYQSAAFGLWYSGAEEGWEPARRLAEAYHEASGYRLPRADENTGETDGPIDYEITGSADDYFHDIGHPNLTVELTNHYDIDWERNLAGFDALLEELR